MKGREYIFIFCLLAVIGIANSQMDVIKFQPHLAWFDSNWWLALDGFSWDQRSWFTKNIFSFVSDGWHFLKAVQIFGYSFLISYFINKELEVHCKIIGAVIIYAVTGLFFELGYNFLKG